MPTSCELLPESWGGTHSVGPVAERVEEPKYLLCYCTVLPQMSAAAKKQRTFTIIPLPGTAVVRMGAKCFKLLRAIIVDNPKEQKSSRIQKKARRDS